MYYYCALKFNKRVRLRVCVRIFTASSVADWVACRSLLSINFLGSLKAAGSRLSDPEWDILVGLFNGQRPAKKCLGR